MMIEDNIPEELKQLDQWVVWRTVPKAGSKQDTVSFDPKTGGSGKSDDPARRCARSPP